MVKGNVPEQRGSDAPRVGTPDPNRFVIPERYVSEELARRLREESEPVPARPAATICLVREMAGALEVLLLRRPGRSRFAADAWVFPGGAVDEADRDPELPATEPMPELTGFGAADRAEAAGYLVAAVREAWEETGILLGRVPAAEESRVEPARAELLSGSSSFPAIVRREGWRIRFDEMLHIAHWITPEAEPRRYDTHFFLAHVPERAECLLSGDELVEARWFRVEDALREFRAGSLRMLPPTVHTLQRVAGHSTYEELRRALAHAPVPTILPRMRRVPDGVAIEIGDSAPDA